MRKLLSAEEIKELVKEIDEWEPVQPIEEIEDWEPIYQERLIKTEAASNAADASQVGPPAAGPPGPKKEPTSCQPAGSLMNEEIQTFDLSGRQQPLIPLNLIPLS
jgi:hypothetical protein